MSCQCLFLPRRDDKALLFCSERGRAAAALPWKRLPVALHSLPTVQLHPTPRSPPPRGSAALPVPASAFSEGHSFHQKRKKERKMKLIKLVLLISKDPVWVSYRKSNTVTRATPTLPLSPIFKQRLGSSHSEISAEGVRFRPICGINKCRLLGKCALAPCLISPPSHGCAELNNLTSG